MMTRTVRHATVLSLLLLAATMLVACDRLGEPYYRLRFDDAAVVARGRSIYDAHCMACHGDKLQGQPNWRIRDPSGRLPAPPHDASGHTWHHPDEVLFRITKLGVAKASNLKDYQSAMPAYEGTLSDEEIVAVLSWIKSQWPARQRQAQEEVNTAHQRERSR